MVHCLVYHNIFQYCIFRYGYGSKPWYVHLVTSIYNKKNWIFILFHPPDIKGGAPYLVKLVYITSLWFIDVYSRDIEYYLMGSRNSLITGGHHLVWKISDFNPSATHIQRLSQGSGSPLSCLEGVEGACFAYAGGFSPQKLEQHACIFCMKKWRVQLSQETITRDSLDNCYIYI
jgi:hypothetical protein